MVVGHKPQPLKTPPDQANHLGQFMPPVFEDKRSLTYTSSGYHHIPVMQAHSKLALADDFPWYHSEGNDEPLPSHAPTDGMTQRSAVGSGMWSRISVSLLY